MHHWSRGQFSALLSDLNFRDVLEERTTILVTEERLFRPGPSGNRVLCKKRQEHLEVHARESGLPSYKQRSVNSAAARLIFCNSSRFPDHGTVEHVDSTTNFFLLTNRDFNGFSMSFSVTTVCRNISNRYVSTIPSSSTRATMSRPMKIILTSHY